jgi:hypothetical protein
MDLDRGRPIGQLATAAPPRAGIPFFTRVEHCAYVDGNISLTQDFTGPAVRIEFWGNGARAQEGPPRSLPVGVLPVCVWSCLLLTWLLLLLFPSLNSKR